eukprot:SAG22_NODE_18722_length_282_cov_1.005464_1_plen_51_part_10
MLAAAAGRWKELADVVVAKGVPEPWLEHTLGIDWSDNIIVRENPAAVASL